MTELKFVPPVYRVCELCQPKFDTRVMTNVENQVVSGSVAFRAVGGKQYSCKACGGIFCAHYMRELGDCCIACVP